MSEFSSSLSQSVRYRGALLSVRERTMMELMNRLSDKMTWNVKVFDDKINAKWKTEALNTPDVDLSEKMVDWVGILLGELLEYFLFIHFIRFLLSYKMCFTPII